MRSNDYILPAYKKAIDTFAAAGGDPGIPEAILGMKREYLDAAPFEFNGEIRKLHFENP